MAKNKQKCRKRQKYGVFGHYTSFFLFHIEIGIYRKIPRNDEK